ncbi:MAG: hypothetical protein E6Q55_13680 [Mycolicibacterium mageritense]|nr:MAG: hypothetical protein E6Q55_13680 [Mycolicibacterium mageritense]
MAHPKPGNDTPGTVTPGSRNSTTPRDLPLGPLGPRRPINADVHAWGRNIRSDTRASGSVRT